MNSELFLKNLDSRRRRYEQYRCELQRLRDEERALEIEISTFSELLNKFNDFPSTMTSVERQLDDNKKNIKEKAMLLVKAQLPSHSSNTEHDDLEHQRNILKKLLDERKLKEKLVNEKKFKKPVNKAKYLLREDDDDVHDVEVDVETAEDGRRKEQPI
ncbi:unnamed protein product [Auanema sp. JU1783]|nr:unnamed protein product [Auanema sp. JU1783]